MKTLRVFDEHNYDPKSERFTREAARAIILNDSGTHVALVHSEREGYYVFPGGGIQKGETHEQALMREALEEAGLRLLPQSIREYGILEELRCGWNGVGIFDHRSYYYYAQAEQSTDAQHLDGYECELGYKLEWCDIRKAYETNQRIGSLQHTTFILREAYMLGLLLGIRDSDRAEHIELRIATPADASAIADIYAPYVLDTAVSFEYQPPDADSMAQRIRDTLEHYPWLVAVRGDEVLGYAYASRYHPRAAYDWTAETSIYIRSGCHKMGIGQRLYAELERLLRCQRVECMVAEIASTDRFDDQLPADSLVFHRNMGFTPAGTIHGCGRKFGKVYDVTTMEKRLGSDNSCSLFIPFASLRASNPTLV